MKLLRFLNTRLSQWNHRLEERNAKRAQDVDGYTRHMRQMFGHHKKKDDGRAEPQ